MINNEILWGIMLLVNFGAILLAYKLWGKIGLYIFIPIATIVANIQVLKSVDLFIFQATLGNIVYASSFLITDILSENYGEKSARTAVGIGFFSLITTTILMSLAITFIPNENDFAQESLVTIFGFLPRLTIASLTAYLLSQTHDIWSYAFWKRKKPHFKFIFLRNNLSTIVSQFIDSFVFTAIAFTGIFGLKPIFEWDVVVSIFWSTFIMKFIVAILDTPFIYIAAKWKKDNVIKELEYNE